MRALLLFHFKAGVRLAVQSFAPVFAAMVAWIMLSIDWAGTIRALARGIFARQPDTQLIVSIAALAFAFAFAAAPRLAHGLNGWIRHMPFTESANRRALAFALVVVQAPLVIGIVLLGIVARYSGLPVLRPVLLRLLLVFGAGAFAAMPVSRRLATRFLSLTAAGLALFGPVRLLIAPAFLLVLADAVAGPIRSVRCPKSWKPADTLFNFRLAWRALRWRIATPYIAGLLALGATGLFAANNRLPPPLFAGAVRLGGCAAVLVFLAGQTAQLAVRRPIWPWSRSLPWSATRRVAADALFFFVHALPLVLTAALFEPAAGCAVLAVAPFLCLRAAAHLRRTAGRRTAVGGFVLEAMIVAGLVALLPWTAVVFCVGSVPALGAAREAERDQKATRWSERHHRAAGDSLSWSSS